MSKNLCPENDLEFENSQTVMGETCRETLCTSCAHLEVCKLKETYIKAQEAVDRAIISDSCINDDGKSVTKMTYVANLRDWLTVPQLRCKYYSKKSEYTVRNFNESTHTQALM